MNLLTGDAFATLFTSFEATADRLELRDSYRSDLEDEVTRRYIAGEPDDLSWAKAWLDQIRALTDAGKRFRRVRVVSVPLSDYQRCGVDRVSPHNIAAGEDVRYLDRTTAAEELGAALPAFDYWLFDAGRATARAAILRFDGDGLLGAEIVTDPAMKENLAAQFARLYELARPQEEFARARGLR